MKPVKEGCYQAEWKEEQILEGSPSYLTSVVRFHSIVVRSVRSSYSIQPFHRSAELYVVKRNFRRREIGWGVRGRDRKGSGGKGMETEELHTWFPPSPSSEVFRAMLVRARDHRLAAWNLADKVAQSCVHYEIREAEGYGEWKKWNAGQTRRPIVTPILPIPHRRVAYFIFRWLNFCPRVMIAWWENFQLQSLNAISVFSNYIVRNWLNNNKP